MEHGTLTIGFDKSTQKRTLVYSSYGSNKRFEGTLDSSEGNYPFSITDLGERLSRGDYVTYRTGEAFHRCGASGFGQGQNDSCPACDTSSLALGILKDITFLLEGNKRDG